MSINIATQTDLNEWVQLALELWPDYDFAEMQSITSLIAQSPTETAFIVRNEHGVAVGFINLSLRSDYVPGGTQKPVAYVEGIYVRDVYQQQSIGRQLIEQAKEWAKERGCRELGSDVLIDNQASAEFHSKVGFNEVERTVFFIMSV